MTAVPSQEQVKNLLDYDPTTGAFTWKKRSGPFKTRLIGCEAGTAHSAGYWCISISGNKWLAHQIAWLHFYGSWPETAIDHINRDKRDNRILNLRLANALQNTVNASIRKDNTSGFRGVQFSARRNRWLAVIECGGRKRQLGSFKHKEEAAAVYADAASKMFGEFCPDYLRVAA